MVRLKLDENVLDSVARLLSDAGHDVDLARDEGLSGAPDDDVLAAATRERRVMVSLDLDLADVVRHDPRATSGIIVLRPHQPLLGLILATARSALELLDEEGIDRQLWIVTESRVRVWPSVPPA